METVTVELLFLDITTLQAAGIRVPETGSIQALPGAVPAAGDVVTFAGLNYSGSEERARFRVHHRAHLFGGTRAHRVQLSLELVVLHAP